MVSRTQPSERQLSALRKRAEAIIAQHADIIVAAEIALATDYKVPAQRTINFAFARIDTPRFTPAGDDLWEMITAIRNDSEYERPERRLIQRWAQY